jgi:hypothetical protein
MIAKCYNTGLNSLCRRNCRRTKRFSNLPEMGFVSGKSDGEGEEPRFACNAYEKKKGGVEFLFVQHILIA